MAAFEYTPECIARWELEARREYYRWHRDGPCSVCGEWIGHFGGSVDRDPCRLIPDNVPLEELRPNCMAVRRVHMADKIRAHCKT